MSPYPDEEPGALGEHARRIATDLAAGAVHILEERCRDAGTRLSAHQRRDDEARVGLMLASYRVRSALAAMRRRVSELGAAVQEAARVAQGGGPALG